MPTIPPEGVYTDAERDFIENEPYRLFPSNQDSFWGQLRKTFTDQVQGRIDALGIYYRNMVVSTAEEDLDIFEDMVGVPVAPSTLSLEQRRAVVMARMRKGPWTHEKRRRIIEPFIEATFGDVIRLFPAGVPLPPGGVAILAGTEPVTNYYRVYEDIRRFSYLVKIGSTTTPNIPALEQVLEWMTPAGIDFTIDNTDPSPLDYRWLMLQFDPDAYFRLDGGLADETLNALALTTPNGAGGTPADIAGLLIGDGNRARTFDGVDDYYAVVDSAAFDPSDDGFSVIIWANPTDFQGLETILGKDGEFRIGGVSSADRRPSWSIRKDDNSAWETAQPAVGTNLMTYGQKHMLSASYDVKTNTQSLYLDGLPVATRNPVGVTRQRNTGNSLTIGRNATPTYYSGEADEPVYVRRSLSAAEHLLAFNTGNDILS